MCFQIDRLCCLFYIVFIVHINIRKYTFVYELINKQAETQTYIKTISFRSILLISAYLLQYTEKIEEI